MLKQPVSFLKILNSTNWVSVLFPFRFLIFHPFMDWGHTLQTLKILPPLLYAIFQNLLMVKKGHTLPQTLFGAFWNHLNLDTWKTICCTIEIYFIFLAKRGRYFFNRFPVYYNQPIKYFMKMNSLGFKTVFLLNMYNTNTFSVKYIFCMGLAPQSLW